jgi:hypothetical protein
MHWRGGSREITPIYEEKKMKTGLMASGIALLATLGLSFAATAGTSVDTDGDGVYDVLDNCSQVMNAPPSADCDTDNDGYGNACDGDFDQDAFTSSPDFTICTQTSSRVASTRVPARTWTATGTCRRRTSRSGTASSRRQAARVPRACTARVVFRARSRLLSPCGHERRPGRVSDRRVET